MSDPVLEAEIYQVDQHVFAHTSRFDNPHKTTSDQVGAISIDLLPSLTPSLFTVVAQSNFNAFDPATITGFLADSGNSAHLGKVIGIVQAATLIGFAATITTFGSIKNAGWSWTPGAPIFLNGTSLSQTPPATGFIQQIGIAKLSDTIFVELSPPIKL